MAKRLAFVIRGAVSLGSYESGVLYEVLRAIEQHNKAVQDPARRIEIDVLVGASAGSMTSAIAARTLVGAAESLRGVEDNPFYDVWVKEVSLVELLRYRKEDDPAASLLSGEFITELGRKHLGTAPTGTPHTAAPSKGTIRLAFALSNLRGLDYDSVTSGTAFPYTRFQDEWRGEGSVKAPGSADWNTMVTTAVASGAFPAAFPVRAVVRRRDEYNTHFLSKTDWPATEPVRTLPYVDGGVFNNEPLGLAKELVDCEDDHRDVDNRFYLYVSPSPKESDIHREFPQDVLHMVGALLHAVIGQAQYQDLSALAKTNRKVAGLNATAAAIAAQVATDPEPARSMAIVAPALAAAAFANVKPPDETLAQATQRLKEQYRSEPWYAQDLAPSPRADTWAALLAAFERAATLHEKDEMALLTICADDSELLGDPLAHFGGFTSEPVRRYDYEVGRAKAQSWLQSNNPLGIALSYASYEPIDLGATRAAAIADLRNSAAQIAAQLGGRVGEQLDVMMERAGVAWIFRKLARPVVEGFAAHYIRGRLLEEASSRQLRERTQKELQPPALAA